MITLRSFVTGNLVAGQGPFATLENPATEVPLASTSTNGIDFRAVVDHARAQGGPALRSLSFVQRGALLTAASKALHGARDELLTLAMHNGGNTRGDAKFDVDGAIGTLAAYGELGQKLGDATYLRDGVGVQPTRSAKFWGEHFWFPRRGVALHINAFNFPAWGLCEKAAVAWLCGVPVISKPATSTALVAARIAEILAEKQILPQGALQFLAGGVGDLLDHLGGQDLIAFTGSSDTGQLLRRNEAVWKKGARLNVEADSLNVALLGPDGEAGSEVYDLFLSDVVRDMTQKTGQKCTAARRILVPASRMEDVVSDLVDRLSAIRVGNPEDEAVQMGPLTTAAQFRAVGEGIRHLLSGTDMRLACGGPERVDGLSAEPGKGYYLRPTLLICTDKGPGPVHEHEVFGPVATLLPYNTAEESCLLAERGGGGLVASVYSEDRSFVPEVLKGIGAYHGRIFLGSSKMGGSLGPGTVLPHLNHGGPGRAGDGHELGGERGMEFYMQRCAVSGYRPQVEALIPKTHLP